MVILACLPLMAMAQNTWEMPDEEETAKVNPDRKYLAGAVPERDGRVVFADTIKVPGKSAGEIYAVLKQAMTRMTKESNQLEMSRLAIADTTKHLLAATFQEWLVFKSSALVLDRTRLNYTLIARCYDGRAEVEMTRISYLYDEERTPQNFKAEEWITDRYGLKKNRQGLARVSGKFRKKTIDRKNYIFNKFEKLLNAR